jgi:hypothetical protein
MMHPAVSARGDVAAGRAVGRMIRWLDTMRGPGGFGGPVVHWWRDCLLFCGPGLDWRYEGLIDGFLTLLDRTGQMVWLERAEAAGLDLVRGQRLDGSFRDSAFELNPGNGGTPHEAAADIGLLLLSRCMRGRDLPGWQRYLDAARKNLLDFYVARLWSPTERRFRERPTHPSFVPNKSATLVEALCLLSAVTGRDEYVHRYVRPTADAILAHQVTSDGRGLAGAIAQNSVDGEIVEKYFPYYNARCVPGLLAAYEWLGDERYLDGALRAMAFVFRWRDSDGGFAQVIYRDGRVNRYPRWIAAVGDVLRAAGLLQRHGFDVDLEPTRRWLDAGQLPSGAFKAADGFASRVSQAAKPGPPDVRDLLPVVGWNDKALRYLAGLADSETIDDVMAGTTVVPAETACRWKGRPATYREDGRLVEVRVQGVPGYRWHKGEPWAYVSMAATA